MPLIQMQADPEVGNTAPLIEIRGLKTHFSTDDGVVRAVDGVDLHIYENRTLCVLGESGCGKSILARSILRIVDPPGKVVEGAIRYKDSRGHVTDLASLRPNAPALRQVRGREISMIFQEPMSSLGPITRIGDQIVETILLHRPMSKVEAKERAIDMLARVGIPRPAERFSAYPFELSGGMRQRAMIAMALSCRPRLLIADEPTTALDVTTQAQILDLIAELQDELKMGVVLITHDLGVVAEVAQDVAVMYMGKVVEYGDVMSIFEAPQHPYTRALLASVPRLGAVNKGRLPAIRGMVPHPLARPTGCSFRTRCDRYMRGVCDQAEPALIRHGPSEVACFLYSGETADV